MLMRFVSMPRANLAPRHLMRVIALALVTLAAAAVVVAILESRLGVEDASAVFIVCVVTMATVYGTTPAALTAIAAFLLYDFLFTQPYLTLVVADPAEWVNLVLFLIIAVVVGRLAALQQERAAEADRRAREAQALFGISRTLATATTVAEAAPGVLARLAAESGMTRIWFSIGAAGTERTILDSKPAAPRPRPRLQWTLLRAPGDHPAKWLRTHVGGETRPAPQTSENLFRVKIEVEGEAVGSLWATRPSPLGLPNRESTRLLALAADQLGLAVHRDELSAAANAAEISRQSDALKSALLTSVSHDLRTPLASIRAAAGTLIDPGVPADGVQVREAALAIDREADRLNRLVRNLLDLSRIEGGALRPDVEVFEVDDLLEPVIARVLPLFDGRQVELKIEPDLPAVRADAVYLDEAVTNLLENSARYAGDHAHARVRAGLGGAGLVRVTVEDDGPGAPPEAMPHLFEKFYRAPGQPGGQRRGMGIGLSVVKGLVEAMGGEVSARRSSFGGLAVDLDLPAVSVPAPAVPPLGESPQPQADPAVGRP